MPVPVSPSCEFPITFYECLPNVYLDMNLSNHCDSNEENRELELSLRPPAQAFICKHESLEHHRSIKCARINSKVKHAHF